MQTNVNKNIELGFTDNQWGQLIESNALLIMWFLEWNNRDWHNKPNMFTKAESAETILEFFAKKYQQSAGCEPWPMGGKVSLDGKFVSLAEGDDDLDPYFMIDTPDGVGYIYPYAFVALPKKGGGHSIVRMD
tara:strand:- start:215 stop:610 length:396 start_codon:yes stop_codon:yes gene_type:complete